MLDHIRDMGHVVREQTIMTTAERNLTDTQSAFRLNTILSTAVQQSSLRGSLPVILAGNCITAVGTLAGLQSPQIRVLWLDAHGDFNTPETTRSGYLDGMALSVVCGNCWSMLASTDPLYLAVREENVFLVGGRDFDPAETKALGKSQIKLITPELLRKYGGQIPEFAGMMPHDLYVHFDADVLDSSVGHPNCFASAGGLFPKEVTNLLSWISARCRIRALAITAYDPECDTTRAIEKALAEAVGETIEAISKSAFVT
jgi:arginase